MRVATAVCGEDDLSPRRWLARLIAPQCAIDKALIFLLWRRARDADGAQFIAHDDSERRLIGFAGFSNLISLYMRDGVSHATCFVAN